MQLSCSLIVAIGCFKKIGVWTLARSVDLSSEQYAFGEVEPLSREPSLGRSSCLNGAGYSLGIPLLILIEHRVSVSGIGRTLPWVKLAAP